MVFLPVIHIAEVVKLFRSLVTHLKNSFDCFVFKNISWYQDTVSNNVIEFAIVLIVLVSSNDVVERVIFLDISLKGDKVFLRFGRSEVIF